LEKAWRENTQTLKSKSKIQRQDQLRKLLSEYSSI
jgi:hypothetical protein